MTKRHPYSLNYKPQTFSPNALRELVFLTIEKAADGLTSVEVAATLKRDGKAIRPRLSELAAMGKIATTGERRERASVWRCDI